MHIKEIVKVVEMATVKKPCVYFLTNDEGDILYIGKSKKSLFGRLGAHEYEKQFSRVFFIECSGYKEMDALESRMIINAKPLYNKAVDRKSVGLISINDIKKEIKVDRRFIRKAAEIYNIGTTTIGSGQYYEKGIIDAVKNYIGSLKKCPISIDYQLWITCGKHIK